MLDALSTPGAMDAAEEEKLRAIVEKEEPATRQLNRFWAMVVSTISVGMAGFYIYTAGTLPAPVQWQRGLYVMLTYILILLLYPAIPRKSSVRPWMENILERLPGWLRMVLAPKSGPSLIDLILIALTVGVVSYYIRDFRALQFRAGAYNYNDYIVGSIGLLISLEIARRVLGWSMTIIGGMFILYLRFGSVLYDVPILNTFAHRGRSAERAATTLFFDQEGVFGIMANVLVSYVILFIFFGAFLRKSGASRFFIDLPLALAGRSTGGPAKVSVISSALFGSISGSAIANTVSTGSFTIPLMKRSGFRPHVAGAIEPSASIGGAFMPPVMGAGAFLMAELTAIPYPTIVLISIFPAILYFLSVLTMVHFEAKKYNLRGIETGVSAMDIIRKEWYMSVPLLVLVIMMMSGFSPGYSAFWSILSCVALMYTMPNNAADFKNPAALGGNLLQAAGRSTVRVVRSVIEAMEEGVRDTLVIGATVGVIGMIVGTIYATGIGGRFAKIITDLAGGNVVLAIMLIGLASLVLGMGVPVTAAYLITAVIMVPALTDLGIALIAAHMIVYWFSQDSNITPPVCVAAYAGAAIAGADPWKTGWTAFKFAKLLYVMPFLFAFSPAILLIGHSGQPLQEMMWGEVALAFFSGFMGTIAFSAVSMFYLVRQTTWWEWIIAAIGAFLCFWPNLATDLVGIAIFASVWFWQYYDVKRRGKSVAPAQPAT
ncbi:TRAP transporter permease [Candidatus Chloroploca asiatica]|uniref:C4-dicarboxylate ABC transporter permease n=1 Tax=Candidatus Chloroploca asiatica TaxID=1506545 RepID=A0A2H3KP89_9CHLR|nr:C4-dicarboxylate ABC transporter permease [Candidatus Chloroploca asiatica]